MSTENGLWVASVRSCRASGNSLPRPVDCRVNDTDLHMSSQIIHNNVQQRQQHWIHTMFHTQQELLIAYPIFSMRQLHTSTEVGTIFPANKWSNQQHKNLNNHAWKVLIYTKTEANETKTKSGSKASGFWTGPFLQFLGRQRVEYDNDWCCV